MKIFNQIYWRLLLLAILLNTANLSVKGAYITFNNVYNTTTITSSKITTGTLLSGSSFKFISANPADATFKATSGGDVSGQLTYISGGQTYTINGLISKQVGTGTALVFIETTVLGGTIYTSPQNTILLIAPGNESSFAINTQYSMNAAFKVADLNTVLSTQTSNSTPIITSNGGGTIASVSISENTTSVTTVTATDANSNLQTSPYAITGGADASIFTINATNGLLTFTTAPNYEIPTDAGQNNVYDVQVTVSDQQGATDIQDIAVSVTNTNDNTPVITSTSSISILQGTTAVLTVTATDADAGSTLIYSINGGTNSGLFTINSSTGVLSFINPAVLSGTPYQVIVKVTDGTNFSTQTLSVTVSSTDTTAPTLTITTSDNNLASGETCTLSFKFSELIQNFISGDITVNGGSLSGSLTQSVADLSLYTIQFIKNGLNTATNVNVAASSYQDMSNNNGTAASLTLTYDVVAPTVAISAQANEMGYGETQIITFTFTENPSSSFSANDISVTNGIISNLLQSATPTIWTVSLKAISATGSASIAINNLSYTDPAGNPGAGSSLSMTLTSPSIDLANNSTSDTGISSFDNITSNQKPVIEGVAPGNTIVTVALVANSISYSYSVNVPVGGIWTLNLNSATGSPTLPIAGLPEGYVGLTITTAGAATASSSFLIDITAPNAPVVTANSYADNTPTITGTADNTDSDILTVIVNGVTYTQSDGYLSYNATTKTWSLTIPDANALLVGSYTVTATVTDAAGNSISNTTATNISITANVWTGNGTWNSVSNWSAGSVPNIKSDVLVSNGLLTVDQNVSVKNFTVDANANLTLSSGKTLSVNGDFIISSDANSTGTFLDNGGTLSATGNIIVQQYLKGGRNWYVSSPLSAASTNGLRTLGNSLYNYNEPDGTWLITDTQFSVTRGYVVKLAADGYLVFNGGTLNTGDKPVSLTKNPTTNTLKSGFNLVGNPYPSYLNAQTAINAGTNIEPTLWYRTKNLSNSYVFDTYNSTTNTGTNNNGIANVTNIVPPMQSFWIKVADNQTTGSLTFTNSMRLHDSKTNKLKAPESKNTDQQILRLVVSNGINSDESIIVFNANASNGFDAFDSPKMMNGNANIPEIYTIAGSEKCVINGFNNMNDIVDIPLGFYTGTPNTFTIKANEITNFDSETEIILSDNLLNTEIKLSDGAAYNFESDIATTIDRFSVKFRAPSITTNIENISDKGDIKVFKNSNSKLVISSNIFGNQTTASLYNSMGQKIFELPVLKSNTEISQFIKPGVYFIHINKSGNVLTRKIVVD